ncbi:MAG: universal stress protein [Candidatus Omnitrophota bacterium]
MKKKLVGKLIAHVLVLAPEKGSFPHLLKIAVQFAGIFKARVRLLESLNFASEKPRIPAIKPEETEAFYREYLEALADKKGVVWDAVIFGDSLEKALKEFSSDDLLVLLKGDSSFDLKEVLREAPCPVLIVPQVFTGDFKEVLLAHVNGRPSDRALGIAALLNKQEKAHVRVLATGAGSALLLRAAQSWAQYLFETWNAKADCKILHGDMKQMLLQECDSGKAALLILGANELEDWRDHRFRLFSHAMAEEANCPVMMVK